MVRSWYKSKGGTAFQIREYTLLNYSYKFKYKYLKVACSWWSLLGLPLHSYKMKCNHVGNYNSSAPTLQYCFIKGIKQFNESDVRLNENYFVEIRVL